MRRLLLVTIAVFALAPAAAQAADTCTSTGDGDWNAPGTWANCSGGVPTEDDTVSINGDHVYLDTTNTTEVSAVTLNYGRLSVTAPNFAVITYQQFGGVLAVNHNTEMIAGTAQINGEDSFVRLAGLSELRTLTTTLTGGATLTGFGTVTGEVVNESGVVAPGDGASAGKITVGHPSVFSDESAEGIYAQGVDGRLEITVNGTDPGQFDQIDVAYGGAQIGGTLAVNRTPGLVTTGRSLPIIMTDNGEATPSLAGTFAAVTGLGDLTPSYTTADVILHGPNLTDLGPTPVVPPAVAAAPAAAPVIPAKPTLTLPSSGKCRKSVSVKIAPPSGTTIATASVKAGSKKVGTRLSKSVVTARIKLKKRTKVSITARTSAGGTQTASKTYKRCK